MPAERYNCVSVLFSDIKGFTDMSSQVVRFLGVLGGGVGPGERS